MKLLAIETSTETMSVGVEIGGASDSQTPALRWTFSGEGGAAASARLLPAIADLMLKAQLRYGDLDAIVFGQGPGAFTGLRTAAAVVQGLAFGANIAVLPVSTMAATAQNVRADVKTQGVAALLDARMGQVYGQHWANFGNFEAWLDELSTAQTQAALLGPQELPSHWQNPVDTTWVGNAMALLTGNQPDAVGDGLRLAQIASLPTASALLDLAPGLIARGGLKKAEEALPIYVRDNVAQTMAQRAAAASANIARAARA